MPKCVWETCLFTPSSFLVINCSVFCRLWQINSCSICAIINGCVKLFVLSSFGLKYLYLCK